MHYSMHTRVLLHALSAYVQQCQRDGKRMQAHISLLHSTARPLLLAFLRFWEMMQCGRIPFAILGLTAVPHPATG